MAGPRGVSGISIEGDVTAGLFYVPRAKKMLQQLANRIEVGGIRTASDFARLDDHAYCYAIVAMGIQRAVIVVDPLQRDESVAARNVAATVPDFVSGCTSDGRITDFPPDALGRTQPPVLRGFWPTPASAQLHDLSDSIQTSARLAVDPYPALAGALAPPADYAGPRWSQYVKCRPTLYSGRMRWVVQLLLGFGKQVRKSIYDRTPPPVGTPRQRRRLKESPSAYEREVLRDGRQIRYDWRWYRTHGIAVGADGKHWIVEIGNTRGVLAMPLPLMPLTDLAEFREKLEDMGDSAGLAALDAFGGYPTGESIPAGEIEPWIRAGRVVRLSSIDDLTFFYQKSTFSSAMGWAWNERGDEARNMAWEMGLSGYIRATHFGYSVTLGAIAPRAAAPNAGTLRARIAGKASDAHYAANHYKVGRLDESDIGSLLSIGDVDSLYAALDAATATPVGTGSGHLWIAHEGYLYKPGNSVEHYELKYPWPELGYLLSFDMKPALSRSRIIPYCDTDVHSFFDGDELKYCRYFNDSRTAVPPAIEDDSDGCELVGVFTRTENQGLLHIPPMVYTNQFDHRRELVGARSVRICRGRDLGYTQVYVIDDLTFPPRGRVGRTKRFSQTVTFETFGPESIGSAMVMPFYDRCAYYYAVTEAVLGHTKTVTHSFKDVTDPWHCETWRNFPGFTGRTGPGGNFIRGEHPSGCGPVDPRTVMAPGGIYQEAACSDFADAGSWCNTCDNADSMVYFIPQPPAPPGDVVNDPPTQTRQTFLVNASGLTPLAIETRTFTGAFTGAAYPWFKPSPDPETLDTQYAEVAHNTFGDGKVMRYSKEPNGTSIVIGGPQPPGFLSFYSPTFIGVVP